MDLPVVARGAPVLFVDEDWVAVLAVRSAALGDASVVVVLPVGAPLDVLRVEPLSVVLGALQVVPLSVVQVVYRCVD